MKQKVYEYSYESRRKRRSLFIHALTIAVSVIVFILLFLHFVLFPVHINSVSMETDISKGSSVFICPLARNPSRGDVVYISRLDGYEASFFENIVNLLTEFFTAQKYAPFGYTHNMTGKAQLRRVLALPGDTIYMRDYVLYVKPKDEDHYLSEYELAKKPYNLHIYSVPAEWDGMGACGDMNEMVLEKDFYFVLADNRIDGTDSRIWGPISADKIKGRALIEYFPFSKIRIF